MNNMFIMTMDSRPSTNPCLNPQWLSWHPQTIERSECATPNLKLQGVAHSSKSSKTVQFVIDHNILIYLICPSLSNIFQHHLRDILRKQKKWSMHLPSPRCSFPAATKVINHLHLQTVQELDIDTRQYKKQQVISESIRIILYSYLKTINLDLCSFVCWYFHEKNRPSGPNMLMNTHTHTRVFALAFFSK